MTIEQDKILALEQALLGIKRAGDGLVVLPGLVKIGSRLVVNGVVQAGDPSADADLTTKSYVDTNFASNLHTHSHTVLSDIGTNTHAQIDTFVGSKAAASGLASLNASSLVVQNPANATATPTASKIPIADANGKLDGWINDASTTVKGKVELATDGETAAGVVVQGNDGRLSNARTPTAHNLLSASHGDTLADTVVAGDIIIGNATPKFARLAKGTRGYRMTVGATLPEWQAETGWIDAGAMTWTYASASTFTVAGDQRAIFQKGTFLKFTQTSVKYAVVASSSYSSPNTTVTIVVNTTYTIANATITAPYYSYQANPQGWPALFAFTPAITAGTGTFTTVSASGSLNVVGRMAFVTVTITITTNGTAATSVIAALPITSAALAIFSGRENAATGVMLQGRLAASDTALNIFKYDNTYPGGTGYVIYVSGSYLI